MSDFRSYSTVPTAPAVDALEIGGGDDVNDLSTPVRSLYIGGGDGTLRITTPRGNIRNFVGLIAGNVYPFAAVKVHATGTGSTNIVGLI